MTTLVGIGYFQSISTRSAGMQLIDIRRCNQARGNTAAPSTLHPPLLPHFYPIRGRGATAPALRNGIFKFAPSSHWQHSNSPPALRGRLPSSHSHCIAVATYTSVRQGLLVVYILGMYVSTAPLISQMHASSQQFDKEGRVMNRHAVRRRAARLLPRVRRTWRRRDCGPNPSIMARRRI